MTRICLVRHGETDWNANGKLQGQTNIPLNNTGKKQAEKCRDYLLRAHWDVMISSPLIRAKETAEIINNALELPMIIMDHFKERHFGQGEGLRREERNLLYPNFIFPNMETQEELISRIESGLEEITQRFPGSNVVLVAHGALINAIIHMFHPNEKDIGVVKLLNGGITTIHFYNQSWEIQNFNVVDHLTDIE